MFAVVAGTVSRMADVNNDPKPTLQRGARLPKTFKAFVTRYPALGAAHESVARAVEAAGPLDAKTCALIKIGLSVGAGLESAAKSHMRRAAQHGASELEIEQTILLTMNTCGFPRTVAAWSWAQEQFARDAADGSSGKDAAS
ncbi:MAG: carboxymuconolactone decarboxylase family protein [Phycisphaerae bacterium]|nr:carboxymuconolactone decarboxylase family protein [Phycisphaerae bacterium]